MQMCPICEKVYDESEYSKCPYCSGELVEEDWEYYKICPDCNGTMHWNYGTWTCSDCGKEIDAPESDNDGTIEK